MNSFDCIIGKSEKIKKVKDIALKVSDSDIPVLISGESGTGKELFAQAIHNESRRKNNNFVAINCAALPDNLVESMLFGHLKGSFTGADKNRKGFFEEANGGTIFLDEVGELKLDIQSKILRVLQEQEILPIGSLTPKKIDVRIISATNANIEEMLNNNSLREDLYFRLNSFRIALPQLSERDNDVILLANNFIKIFNLKENKKIENMSKEAMDLLKTHSWPGNIRELKNVIYRAIIMADGPIIEIDHFSDSINFGKNTKLDKNKSLLANLEKNTIESVLTENKWNITNTADILGISRSTLYRKIKEYSIK